MKSLRRKRVIYSASKQTHTLVIGMVKSGKRDSFHQLGILTFKLRVILIAKIMLSKRIALFLAHHQTVIIQFKKNQNKTKHKNISKDTLPFCHNEFQQYPRLLTKQKLLTLLRTRNHQKMNMIASQSAKEVSHNKN